MATDNSDVLSWGHSIEGALAKIRRAKDQLGVLMTVDSVSGVINAVHLNARQGSVGDNSRIYCHEEHITPWLSAEVIDAEAFQIAKQNIEFGLTHIVLQHDRQISVFAIHAITAQIDRLVSVTLDNPRVRIVEIYRKQSRLLIKFRAHPHANFKLRCQNSLPSNPLEKSSAVVSAIPEVSNYARGNQHLKCFSPFTVIKLTLFDI